MDSLSLTRGKREIATTNVLKAKWPHCSNITWGLVLVVVIGAVVVVVVVVVDVDVDIVVDVAVVEDDVDTGGCLGGFFVDEYGLNCGFCVNCIIGFCCSCCCCCCCWCVSQSTGVVGFLVGLWGFGLWVEGLSHDGGLGFVIKFGSVVKCQCCWLTR